MAQDTGAGAYKISGGQNGGTGLLGNFDVNDAFNLFNCVVENIVGIAVDLFTVTAIFKNRRSSNGVIKKLVRSGLGRAALFGGYFLLAFITIMLIVTLIDCIINAISSNKRNLKNLLISKICKNIVKLSKHA